MSILDFFGTGIGGMTPQQTTPGLMGEGDIVTTPSQPIGPTYGDLLKAAVTYGSKPGSSGSKIMGQIPYSSGMTNVQNQIIPLSPQAPKTAKKTTGEVVSEEDSSLGTIGKWFMGLLGVGA